jgi:hypothetical protein
MKYLLLILCASSLCASDALHIPLLVKHHQESHAVAGALVGLGMDWYLKEVTPLRPIPRAAIAIGTALLVGTFKEHVMDRHPRNKEIGPWGVGAAAALALEYTIRW